MNCRLQRFMLSLNSGAVATRKKTCLFLLSLHVDPENYEFNPQARQLTKMYWYIDPYCYKTDHLIVSESFWIQYKSGKGCEKEKPKHSDKKNEN